MKRHLPRRSIRVALLALLAVAAGSASADAAIFSSVSGGSDSTCAIRPGGSVWCWGDGRSGQLGVIGASRARTPLAVIGTYTATQLSVGQAFWCARLEDGTAQCTGAGQSGQIGNGKPGMAQFPQPVSGLTGVTSVSAGDATACAISGPAAQVSCWGSGSRGELGDGQLTYTPSPTPAAVAGVSGATSIAVGSAHACAALTSGRILCWGDTASGKLGTDTGAAIDLAGVPVAGITDASSVVAGTRHSCELSTTGSVWCWGDGALGQLGNGTMAPTAAPVQVSGLGGVVQLSSGASTICALKNDRTVWCWGDGVRGQLGNGGKLRSAVPVQVSGLVDATSIGVGATHACAVTASGATYCWGSNQYAQLGDGAVLGSGKGDATPQRVTDSPKGQATFIPTPLNERGRSDRGGRVELRLLRVRKRGSRCPTVAEVTLRARGKQSVSRISDVERVEGGCAVTARILLPKDTRRASSVVYVVRGTHLKTVVHRLTPRKAA